jgi:hypothetical protein
MPEPNPQIIIVRANEADTTEHEAATAPPLPLNLQAAPREASTVEQISSAFAHIVDYWNCQQCGHQNPSLAKICKAPECKERCPRTDEDKLSVPSLVEDNESQSDSDSAQGRTYSQMMDEDEYMSSEVSDETYQRRRLEFMGTEDAGEGGVTAESRQVDRERDEGEGGG